MATFIIKLAIVLFFLGAKSRDALASEVGNMLNITIHRRRLEVRIEGNHVEGYIASHTSVTISWNGAHPSGLLRSEPTAGPTSNARAVPRPFHVP